MARPDKVAAVDEVAESLSSNAATLLTDYRGLSVTELAELRAKLRENNAIYQVVKNTLTRRAADEAGIDGLESYLVGPTALVFCEDDPVGPMKVLREFMKEHPELLVKAGWVEGRVLDETATTKLADLKSRDDLLAEIAGLFHGALANFARLLQAPLDHQARLLKALEDAGGVEAKGFEPQAPEGAGETDTDEPASAAAAPDGSDDTDDTDDEDGEPEADAAEEPEADVDEEPEADADEEPEADADEEPEADVDEEPEADADEEPEASVEDDSEAAATDDEGVVDQAADAASDAADTAADTVEDVAEQAADVAASAAQTAADVVATAAETAADAVGQVADRVSDDEADEADEAGAADEDDETTS